MTIKLTIDGTEIEVDPGLTVIQACELAGVEVPRFCYHERLKIAGNCRMCLVEIEGGPPKPAASCAMPAADGMVVHTNTPMVKKAREGVMEFLLINHPLDCPICDQGGECDLQDQAMAFGRGADRFKENKRSVKEKDFGPLVKTHMTRCIHCTRCVRFISDVAGVEDLGGVYRGEDMEISTFIEKGISSELSGNIIDLCPVGALTSKPYAFKARSWELGKTESIDVLDAVGSNIRVDSRGREVMRILPRLNEDINEEWISDKTRFAYDGLKNQRLDRPLVRKKSGKFQEASWEEAYAAIAKQFEKTAPKKIAAIAGDLADVESMLALKALMKNLGSPHMDCRQEGAQFDAKNRASYLFNTTIAGIEQADCCLLIGVNPRYDAPLVNARIRKQVLNTNMPVAAIGQEGDLTYPVNNLGDSPEIIEEVASGKHAFSKILKRAKHPMIILGSAVFQRKDIDSILFYINKLCDEFNVIKEGWNGYNVLHKAAARVGGLDIGFVPDKGGKDANAILSAAKKGDIECVYLLGADEIDTAALEKTFVIYQGHHGDRGAHVANVILPGAAYTEKTATYVNLEGRPQRTLQAVLPPGQAKEDWHIISELSEALNNSIEIHAPQEMREALHEIAPHLAQSNTITPAPWKSVGKKGALNTTPIASAEVDFYQTDPISRASQTMAACKAAFSSPSAPAKKQKAKKEAA